MLAPGLAVVSEPRRVALLAAELVANRLRARTALRLLLPPPATAPGLHAALRAHAADGSLPTARATDEGPLDVAVLGAVPREAPSADVRAAREILVLAQGA